MKTCFGKISGTIFAYRCIFPGRKVIHANNVMCLPVCAWLEVFVVALKLGGSRKLQMSQDLHERLFCAVMTQNIQDDMLKLNVYAFAKCFYPKRLTVQNV